MANLLPVFGLTLLFALATSKEARLVLLENHGEAVCLDGSPPGYYFRPGTGSGANKFIVHLEGGGDCESKEECYQRSMTRLGSSSYWAKTADFDGFLSGLEQTNKYFYNWNLVFVKYCDGSCYSGYLSKPFHVYGSPIYFKGNLIVKAIFKSLIEKEFKEATDVILTGCSAGGLGTFIFADYVKSVLPSSIKYRAIADAGYFINSLNINGEPIAKERAKTTFVFQNQTISVHKECSKKYTGDEASDLNFFIPS
ncbi:PREDICTED: pectin acetylesterase 4-like [Amphimedon queenslandica]|uniref:Pectin acetylesterase n=1 Tax=Amphimedon queenslandica TaxID=400682 RepID=A0A1X7TX48_AMPQE|nr:PREDICTED: pectin acetylesterase 4-like [Amphimedon queenslandica]|eukprot:XP_019857269.1 PREDICTED: pectin acetylesterase 4-like [Amphimedon queenslandica]